MATTSIAARLLDQIRKFAAARDGNIAITFGMLSLPLVVAMGGAIDYSRANAARADFQAALDATGLMVSKTAGSMTSDAQLQTAAQAYFASVFHNPAGYTYTVQAVRDPPGGTTVTLSGTTSVNTEFLQIIGLRKFDVTSNTTIKWGSSRLRVALVVDVSGSMNSVNKLTTLKTAAKNLVTQLQGLSTTNGDAYLSIIPFNKEVNAGKSNYTQSWVRWDIWEETHGTCSNTSKTTKSSCTGASATWTAANHNTWNGCVTDRDQDYDTTSTTPSTSLSGTLFPADEYGISIGGLFFNYCPDEVMGLSYDWAALKSKLESLQAPILGTTNQAIGLQWGFQSLTSAPFTIPAKDANYQYNQVIILMSDGLNTQSRYSSTQSVIDAREQITCNNVKAAGILVYTIQVNTGGDPTSTLLQNCASSPSKFFLLTSADQLISAFDTIGVQLTSLRLAQ
jgi:Flp pilus assembly protein TadG